LSIKTEKNLFGRLFFRFFGPVSLIAFLGVSFWASGFFDSLATVLAIGLYGLLFYFLRITYCRILRKDYPKFLPFLFSYVRAVGTVFGVLFWGLAAFCAYENEVVPAELPAYVVSNGEKTLTFRTMSHIATPRFYADVAHELADARKDGYVLFYEGVRPGTVENSRRFDELLGMRFSEELYDSMSELYGLVPQDTPTIASGFLPSDLNADVSIDDIVASFNRRSGIPPSFASGAETASSGAVLALSGIMADTEAEDLATQFRTYAKSLTPRELEIVRYVNRAVMSFVIKGRDVPGIVSSNFGNPELFSAILEDRDAVIAQAVIDSDAKKIYAMYGLLHFDGVFDLLQERDPRWKVSAPSKKLFPLIPFIP
jgi:hypothetical protein